MIAQTIEVTMDIREEPILGAIKKAVEKFLMDDLNLELVAIEAIEEGDDQGTVVVRAGVTH